MVKLVLTFKEVTLEEFPVTTTPVTIGRTPDNDIVIDNTLVSRHHCKIVQDGTDYLVEDLGSGNGTFLNGQHIVKETLRDQDAIAIGKHTLVFIHHDPPFREQPQHATDLAEETFIVTEAQQERLDHHRAHSQALETPSAGVDER